MKLLPHRNSAILALMFEKILQLLREAVENQLTIFTPHAQIEMNEDDLFTFDLEHCVLVGTIVERQKDDSFKEWKYLIEGESTDQEPMMVSVKLDYKGSIVFITTYRI